MNRSFAVIKSGNRFRDKVSCVWQFNASSNGEQKKIFFGTNKADPKDARCKK